MKSADEEVNELEKTLSRALKPVRPPAEVMQRLQKQIGSLEPHRISARISNWELSIITVGSVMFGAMVILTIARALFYFFGRNGSRMA